MSYQIYDGYWLPAQQPATVPNILEPWDHYFKVFWKNQPIGFVSERLNIEATSTGWVRETAAFIGENGPGQPFILNSFLTVSSQGNPEKLDFKIRALDAAFSLRALKKEKALVCTADQNGQKLFDSIEVPIPDPLPLRFDLPLMGLETWSQPETKQWALPSFSGVATQDLKVAVRTADENQQNGFRHIVFQSDNTSVTLTIDAANRLTEMVSSEHLKLEASQRSVLEEFKEQRQALLEKILQARTSRSSSP